MGRIVGIDLGTTKSLVVIMVGRERKAIVNEQGSLIIPSVVAWDEKAGVLVAQIAKRQAVTNAESTLCSAERFIGRKFEEVAEEMKRVPYRVGRASNGDSAFSLREKMLSPQEASAQVLLKLKRAAEDYLGEKVTEAVVTVPAYCNDGQLQATKDAGRIAGLDGKRIVNEPIAAALACGLDEKSDELIAVYDFGGGACDVSILDVGDHIVQVVSTNEDTHLGGDLDVPTLARPEALRKPRTARLTRPTRSVQTASLSSDLDGQLRRAGETACFTNRQMGQADRLTVAAGTSATRLMDNAGKAVAHEAMETRTPAATRSSPGVTR